MKLHANARLGPKGRLVMCRRVVEEGSSLAEAAEAAGVSRPTASATPAVNGIAHTWSGCVPI